MAAHVPDVQKSVFAHSILASKKTILASKICFSVVTSKSQNTVVFRSFERLWKKFRTTVFCVVGAPIGVTDSSRRRRNRRILACSRLSSGSGKHTPRRYSVFLGHRSASPIRHGDAESAEYRNENDQDSLFFRGSRSESLSQSSSPTLF